MCGILGIWNLDGEPVDIAAAQRALGTMAHRGPDGEGFVLIDTREKRAVACAGPDTPAALGLPPIGSFAGERFDLVLAHRRLAILDRSTHGHQPMAGEGGRAWMVHSGEVYDYLERRREFGSGHAFRSGTDTEVLLAMYERDGLDVVDRPVTGMWASAIFDMDRRRLLCWRDPFGIKPFYRARRGNTFVFASEVKAILSALGERAHWNEGMVLDYLAWGMTDHRTETMFEGIEELRAGHAMVVEPARTRVRRYFSLSSTSGDSIPDPAGLIRERLASSVSRHLRSDVAIGTCLSGGVDSSSIVCMASSMLAEAGAEHQKVFTAVFDDLAIDEARFASEVARVSGAEAYRVSPTSEGLTSSLVGLVRTQEQPFISSSVFANLAVMELARHNGVTVLLDGQGGDEVFSGYPQALDRHLSHSLVSGRLATWIREAAHAGLRRAVEASLPRGVRAARRWPRWLDTDIVRTAGLPQDWRYPRYGSLTDVMENDLEFRLPALLRYEERNALSLGLESRVPFLDRPLVEAAHCLADADRIRNGVGKAVLREAMRGMVPDPVLDRRTKVGFETPQARWLLDERWDEVREIAAVASRLPFFNRGEATRLLASYSSGKTRDTAVLWRMLNLGVWVDTFFD